ncbi:purine-nucleoside phosphorylase [Clostridium tyrobutyricum]|uniref:purine-nucleoside phosphorylase n=1 Tax=Clostridium tyrobutyricum TaxID=1519 RepID=UPI00189C9A5E|nr:purine-nucleoside phosphorylase [Clostridium tyrobutyricum]
MSIEIKIKEAANYILKNTKYKPEIGIILGSGLGEIAEEIEEKEIYNYRDIPNFPVSTVVGHKGRLIIGKLQGKIILTMQGRFHYYEGYSMQQITFPVRVMASIGIKNLIVTNAAGAVNLNYKPGQLMLIKDHINLSFNNPLIGKNMDSFGTRFPDMSNAYDRDLRKKVENIAQQNNIDIQEGVYVCMSGPNYETPAEIKMVRVIGGDAVGMSTVPEVIVANHSQIKVIGISCMTNMAAGILDKPLEHREVIEISKIASGNFKKLVRNIVKDI